MAHKGLKRGLEMLSLNGWKETIKTIGLVRSARIPSRVLETRGDYVIQTPVKDNQVLLINK